MKSSTNRLKTLLVTSFKFGITALAFYLISKKIDAEQLVALRFENTNMFAIAVLAAMVLVFLQAGRWHYVLRALRVKSTLRQNMLAVWFGHLLNNILPTSTVGDLVRSYTLRYHGAKQGQWWSAFVAEKFVAMTMALFLATIAAFQTNLGGIPIEIKILVGTLLVVCISGLPVLELFLSVGEKLFSKSKLNSLSEMYLGILYIIKTVDGRVAVVYSFIVNLGMCLVFFAVVNATGIPIDIGQCFFIVPVFSMLAAIQVSYGGWGVRELGSVHLLGLLGVGAEQALATSVLYGVAILLSSLPGLFFARQFVAAIRENRSAHYSATNQLSRSG